MKTLYLHAGMPKTGTTAIQYFCTENRKLLKSKGFYYPEFPFRYYAKNNDRNGLFLFSSYIDENGNRDVEEENRRFDEALAIIRQLFQKHDNLIISNEGSWYALKGKKKVRLQKLRAAADRDGYTIKFIVYLRKQDSFALSLWNQKIKSQSSDEGLTYTWEEFINHSEDYMNLHYDKTLNYVCKVLGKENVIVRRYDRKYLKNGLSQADFLDALGLEWTDEYKISKSDLNEKLSYNGCEIKRVINKIPDMTMSESRLFQKALLSTATISNKEYPCVIWSSDDARNFMARYQEENQKVADNFFADGEALFEDSYSDGEVWQRNNPHMQDDIIRYATASDILLLRKIRAQKDHIETLERTLLTQDTELQELKEQIAELQKNVSMLRTFRQKVKHPFRTIFHALFHRQNRG